MVCSLQQSFHEKSDLPFNTLTDISFICTENIYYRKLIRRVVLVTKTLILIKHLHIYVSYFPGQIIDAIATPIVGIMADKYGTKKFWHLTGKYVN